MSQLIYPKHTIECIQSLPVDERHPLLQLDRFTAPLKQEEQKSAFEEVIRGFQDPELLKELTDRRKFGLQASSDSTTCWTQKSSTSLALHLSRPGVLESAGTCLHPLYGFAYIPATGLKGMARAAALEFGLSPEDVRKIFGGEPDEDHQETGEICFHDAWPISWPKLALDIATPHHTKYYQKTDTPGDWEQPVPLSFLVIPAGTEFEFLLKLRRADGDRNLLTKAKDCLAYALERLGAGGKTNAGYGRHYASANYVTVD